MHLSAFEDHFGTNACLKSLGEWHNHPLQHPHHPHNQHHHHPPRVRAHGERNGRASMPPPARVAHPIVHRSATPQPHRHPAFPDRTCAASHCWDDDYDVLPDIRHLLEATAPRPQAHQQPTEPQEPDHPMPSRSISPASTADQNTEHQRKEPDHAATPPPRPPPKRTSTPHWPAA